MSLRPYQQKGLDEIRSEFSKGIKRVLLWMATGGGKTVVFCEMVKGAVEKEKRCLIVVRGRKLVDQASQRLFREQVPHGVMMAKHWNKRPGPVQVCSIDTLISRKTFPPADLVIIDEAHMAQSDGYKEFLEHYPDAYIVSVTATPYTEKGLKHLADSMVHPVTMQELTDMGYLVPFRYFAPSFPDLSGVKISSSTHDYVVDQLGEVMESTVLTGKIVEHWQKFASDRPTLCFATRISHSKILVERFKAAGIEAEHCDADSTDEERANTIRRLESGQTKVVCNVGIFCTGVDIPRLGAIIMARPTKSYNLFIQQAGRGTRTAEGKSDCILLDHSGNINRHGFPTMEPDVNLDGEIKEESGLKLKTCPVCFCIYRSLPGKPECPECGFAEKEEEAEPLKISVGETDDELLEIEVTSKNPIEQWLEFLRAQQKKTGRKPAWVWYKLIERYPLAECRAYLPQWFIQIKERELNTNPFANSPFTGFGGER